jgi:hypothetical protein
MSYTKKEAEFCKKAMIAGYTAFQAGKLFKFAQMGMPFDRAQAMAKDVMAAPTDGDADNGGNVPTEISPDDIIGHGPSSRQVMQAQAARTAQGVPPGTPVPNRQLARSAILSVLNRRPAPAPVPAAPAPVAAMA